MFVFLYGARTAAAGGSAVEHSRRFFDINIEDFMEALELVSDGNVELLAYALTFYGCCLLCKMTMVFILYPRIMMI